MNVISHRISNPISIVVNGVPQTTTATTLDEWVQAHNLPPNALATAVNGDFVPRTLRAQTVLKAGDAIVTFQAIEGG